VKPVHQIQFGFETDENEGHVLQYKDLRKLQVIFSRIIPRLYGASEKFLLMKPKHSFYVDTFFPKTVLFRDDCNKRGAAGEAVEAANDLNTIRFNTNIN